MHFSNIYRSSLSFRSIHVSSSSPPGFLPLSASNPHKSKRGFVSYICHTNTYWHTDPEVIFGSIWCFNVASLTMLFPSQNRGSAGLHEVPVLVPEPSTIHGWIGAGNGRFAKSNEEIYRVLHDMLQTLLHASVCHGPLDFEPIVPHKMEWTMQWMQWWMPWMQTQFQWRFVETSHSFWVQTSLQTSLQVFALFVNSISRFFVLPWTVSLFVRSAYGTGPVLAY